MATEDHMRQSDLQEWANQLITNDDALSPDWNELLVDTNVVDSEPKVFYLSHMVEYQWKTH